MVNEAVAALFPSDLAVVAQPAEVSFRAHLIVPGLRAGGDLSHIHCTTGATSCLRPTCLLRSLALWP